MPDNNPSNELFDVLREDVSADLVDELLKEQRDIGLFMKVSLAKWEELSNSHPELSHYIAMTAYDVSRGDPLQRERIAASLLGLYEMLDKDIVNKMTRRVNHIIGEDAHGVTMIEQTTSGADGGGEGLQPAA
jgi:hypothetical protein